MKLNKILIIWILFLFLGTCINPSVANDIVKKSSIPINSGNTLYVGGSGEGNYTTIQDAINDASDGDTVFVYDDSSPYQESLRVEKSINLIGENRETTILYLFSIWIEADYVKVSGFTFQNKKQVYYSSIVINAMDYCEISNNYFKEIFDTVIHLQESAKYNKIINNIFINCGYDYCEYGSVITLVYDSSFNIIENNQIIDSKIQGIYLLESSDNIIIRNTLINNSYGIVLEYSSKNNISFNNIYENHYPCMTIKRHSNRNVVYRNIFDSSKSTNIELWLSIFNNIIENSFINSSLLFCVENRDCLFTRWDGNFWIKSRDIPKIIPVTFSSQIPLFWIQFDWRPAKEPYDI